MGVCAAREGAGWRAAKGDLRSGLCELEFPGTVIAARIVGEFTSLAENIAKAFGTTPRTAVDMMFEAAQM